MLHLNSESSVSPAVRPLTDRAATARENARHDLTLVNRFNEQGDESAFLEIMQRYRSKVFSIAFNSLRNRCDAEEVSQDTFVRAHRGLAKFRGDCSLATWMHRIALNLSRNRYWYYFRRQRHTTLSLDCAVSDDNSSTLADQIACEEPGPVEETILEEYTGLIGKCMNRLSPGHSDILNLRSVRNESYAVIAKKLGVEIGTVKSRIARARYRLREEVALACPDLASDSAPGEWFAPSRASASPGLLRAA